MLTAVFAQVASAQSPAQIDGIATAAMSKFGVPGLSLAVVKDGNVAYQKGYGFADLENQVPASVDTVYQIGSMTKQFTGAMVMKLVEDGKLKLDERAKTYLPELPEQWKAITVRHLLTHTSGIKNYVELLEWTQLKREPGVMGRLVKVLAEKPLDFEPGTAFRYNNSGYFILGLLVERVGGKPFEQQLKERLLRPLGMDHTGFNDWSAIIPHRARGYVPDAKNGPRNASAYDPAWASTAGAMVSTITDLIKWELALYDDSALKQSSWKEAWAPTKLKSGEVVPYGFGWRLTELNKVPIVEHGGNVDGFNSQIYRVPSHRLTVIVLTNTDPGIAKPVAKEIAQLFDPSLIPPAVPDPNPKTTAAHKDIFEQIIAGTIKEELFTADARRSLFPAGMEQNRKVLLSLGALESFALSSVGTKGDASVRVYSIMVGKQALRMEIVTEKNGLISSLALAAG